MTKNDFFDAIKIVIIFNNANVCIKFMIYHNLVFDRTQNINCTQQAKIKQIIRLRKNQDYET